MPGTSKECPVCAQLSCLVKSPKWIQLLLEIITIFVFSDKTPLYIKNNEKSSCLGGWSSVPPPFGSLTGHILQSDCLILQAGSTPEIYFSILVGVYRNHSCSGEKKSCRCSIKPSLAKQHHMVGRALEEDSPTTTQLAAQ